MPLPSTNVTPTAAQVGYGAAFSVGTGLPGAYVYTQIAEVKDIKPSGFTVGEEDVTTLGSPSATREFVPTLVEGGTVEISGNYIADTTQTQLETLAKARTIFPFQFAFPLSTSKNVTRSGLCFITKLAPGADIVADKAPAFNCTMRITGVETEVIA